MKASISWLKISAIALCTAAAVTVSATPPPPEASAQEILCRADLVVIGTASEFRLVRHQEDSRMCQPFDGTAQILDLCTSIEVTVAVDQLLYSKASGPPDVVRYRFGGGLFSTTDLRRDLEGQRMIFHLVDANAGSGIRTTSYPWRLGIPSDQEEAVRNILRGCPR